jgi:predicted metal-dependent hydrolase
LQRPFPLPIIALGRRPRGRGRLLKPLTMLSSSSQLELPPARAERPAGAIRRIVLDGRFVPYTLVRSRRRTLGLTIDHRGLRVGVPERVAMAAIEDFIRGHAEWIARKLAAWQAKPGPRLLEVRDGASVPVLGEPWTLLLKQGHGEAEWGAGQILLRLRAGADPRDRLRQALQQRALPLFRSRAQHLFPGDAASLPRLALSNARTRWGSCSARTGLRFNWRLIHLPMALVDYVVAHELAHLGEMNHSERFWYQVELLYPDYREARRALRAHAAAIPQI